MSRLPAHPSLRLLLFGVGFALLAVLGAGLGARYGDVTMVRPAAGLTVVVLLLAPARRWPSYLGIVIVVDVVVHLAFGHGAGLAGAMALTDAVEPALGAAGLSRLLRGRSHVGPGAALRFLVACAAVAPLAGALIAGSALALSDGGDLIDHWRGAWAADAVGVLAVAPLLLIVRPGGSARPDGRALLGLAAAEAATLAVVLAIFGLHSSQPYPYLVMAPAIGIALRFGGLGAAVTTVLLAGPVLLLTAEGRGPFGTLDGPAGLHQAQVFVVVTAVLLQLAGSVSDAQRRARSAERERLREADDVRRRFERIASSINEGVFTYRRLHAIWVLEYASPAWSTILGIPFASDAGDVLEQRVHPEELEAARAGWVRVEQGDWLEQEYRVIHPDGSFRWVNERLRLRVEDSGDEWIDGIVADVTERRAEEARRERTAARLRVMARTDSLTGLANRRHLSAELERHLAGCRDGGPGLGLLLLDLDRFKVINDTFGHHAGDEILRQTAERIAEATGDTGALAGRWGGEEFCVLLPGVDHGAGLRLVGEAIRCALNAEPMRLADGSELLVTTTVGGAVQLTGTSARAPELVDRADRALYAGKRRGRDRVVLDADLRAGDATGADSDLLHTAQALALAVSIREGVPALHCQQVADLSARTAEHLGLPAAAVLRARLAGWLHDVGKIAIPDRILGKEGPLDAEEWKVMRAHPVIGSEVVRRVPGLELAAVAVEQHHEHWDGSGYPAGRRGEEIALEARIVACADAYSAITSDRVYRPERSRGEGLEELRRSAGSHLDPAVVDAFIAVLLLDEAAFALRLELGAEA